jgi:hypothetical protein
LDVTQAVEGDVYAMDVFALRQGLDRLLDAASDARAGASLKDDEWEAFKALLPDRLEIADPVDVSLIAEHALDGSTGLYAVLEASLASQGRLLAASRAAPCYPRCHFLRSASVYM